MIPRAGPRKLVNLIPNTLAERYWWRTLTNPRAYRFRLIISPAIEVEAVIALAETPQFCYEEHDPDTDPTCQVQCEKYQTDPTPGLKIFLQSTLTQGRQ